ncbi:MAG TPA: acetylxylan esterase [Candidatus Limnocylindrales bacterium]|nr:acetylxylan esterase [Candidatus Limnocylindrales bacterium]
MPYFDWPLEQLEHYRPATNEPPDFDAFWAETLADARRHPLDARFVPVDAGLALIETFDVTFAGYGGQRIKGWYLRPQAASDPLPCVVEYIGYGGGRGYPHDWLLWPSAGYATLVMDTRGQGSSWRRGDTPDLPEGDNPHVPGFMTQGILNPRHYYYRRVFTDAVRAIEAARTRPDVDAARLALNGGSQGGGITLAAAALDGDVALALADVPFLCHFERAVGLTSAYPYQEIVAYLHTHRDHEAQAFSTLAYFDGVHFARRINAEALVSTALMDEICPPSTVFAAYNAIPGKKAINVYRYNGHEGGESLHTLEKLRLLNARWGEKA